MKPTDQHKYLAMATKRMPWEQQPRESGKSFDAFLIFREMGVQRNLAEVARIVGKSGHLIRRWATQWDWYIRVAAWDERLADRRDKAAMVEAEQMGKRQARLGLRLQEVGARRLEDFAVKPELLTPSDTIRMITTGSELERVARGEEKGEAGGNIIFNIKMSAPPSWAPKNVVASAVDSAIEGAVEKVSEAIDAVGDHAP